jgi:hypothetical protein
MPKRPEIAPTLARTIAEFADYKGRPEGVLDAEEIAKLVAVVRDGMSTTCGDTAPCTVTARQLALLLHQATANVSQAA